MFTTIEGDWNEVMPVIQAAVEAVQKYSPRVSLLIRADIRPSVTDGITRKVEDVERYLSESEPLPAPRCREFLICRVRWPERLHEHENTASGIKEETAPVV